MKYAVEISGMTCGSCSRHAREALVKVDELQDIQMMPWQDGKAVVNLAEDTQLPEKKIKKVIKKAGYKVENMYPLSGNIASQTDFPRAEYDLAVIGTGGAGMGAAIEAARLRKTVVLIEKGRLGGTCVNAGCIPSKIIIKQANHFYHANNQNFPGIELVPGSYDWSTLLSERRTLVETLRKEKYTDVIQSYPEITLKQGAARFDRNEENHPILVLDNGETIVARKYVIATGSRPFIPDLPGKNEVSLLNSTDLLFLEKQPRSVVVIGGGFIALELGQALHRLGIEVPAVEVRSRLVSHWDEQISRDMTQYLEEEGLSIHTGSVPVRFFKEDGLSVVVMRDQTGQEREIAAEHILVAMGRHPNTESLNLPAVGVELSSDSGGIVATEFMQTTSPNIYSAGDVADIPKLVYLAAKSGKIAVRHAFGEEVDPLDLTVVPEVIFSTPQLARVGLSEQEAMDRGQAVKIGVVGLEHVAKAIVSNNTKGFIKLVVDGSNDTVVGAQILSENAGELIQTATMAVEMGKRYGFTATQFRDMLFPYLTEVEGLKLAAQMVDMDVAQFSCCAS